MFQWLKIPKLHWLIVITLFLTIINPLRVEAQNNIVRILLFYSPTCPHCHQVINEDLPPMLSAYGGTPNVYTIPPPPEEEPYGPSVLGMYGEMIEILYINTITDLGQTLFREAIVRYEIPGERQAVPTMIISETVLVGSGEIPDQFMELVNLAIEYGGIDWPDLPSLPDAIDKLILAPEAEATSETDAVVTETKVPASTQTSEEATESAAEISPTSAPILPPTVTELSILDRIRLDPVGNSLSILLLLGMLAVLVSAAVQFLTPAKEIVEQKTTWLIPLLCIIGMGVAGYLSYVETSGELAVCGPVGDCNTVQQSSYANLFGLIPIGVLGLVGYVLILGSWLISNLRSNPLSTLAELSLFGMATVGLFFSIYLTFLEPFVIGATCAWCLSSAVIITIIFWLSKDNGRNAINQLMQL
jgi:uncharacterized membrane protein